MSATIAYGECNGEPVHVGAVPSGLACGCRCLNCGETLIARKGEWRAYHFAHRSGVECVGAVEGTLHLIAKSLLASAVFFHVPAYLWTRSATLKDERILAHEQKIASARELRINHSTIECRLPSDFVPDVMLSFEGGEQIFVEIVVTHPIDRLKSRKIRRFGMPTLVMHLTPSDALLLPEALRTKLAGDSTAKRWWFHPEELAPQRRFLNELRAARNVLRMQGRVVRERNRLQRVSESNSALQHFLNTHKRYPTYQDVVLGRFKWS